MEWDVYAGDVRSKIESLEGVEKVYYDKLGNELSFNIYVHDENDEILIHSVAAILWKCETFYHEREWYKDHYVDLDFYPVFINVDKNFRKEMN